MKKIFLRIEQLSKSIQPNITHISLFIPLDGDENTHFSKLFKETNYLLTKDRKDKISKFQINWNKYKKDGFKSIALYITSRGHIEVGLPFNPGAKYIVADTFHVKPLLLLEDYQKRSLVLHFNTNGVSLYRVSSKSFRVIDTYMPSVNPNELFWPETISGTKLRIYMRFIKSEVNKYIQGDITSLIITGLDQKRLLVKDFWNFEGVEINYCFEEFEKLIPNQSISFAQLDLTKRIDLDYEKHISDFLETNLEEEITFDLFKLSDLILKNKIKKLYVSLEDVFFGSICNLTGNTTLNIQQNDTNDKDILNSFLMLCLERDIDVKVIPRNFFPKGLSFFYT